MSKPQRNKPCPCGSGKKYKKCCESKDVAEKTAKMYPERKPMTPEQRRKGQRSLAMLSTFMGSGFIEYHK